MVLAIPHFENPPFLTNKIQPEDITEMRSVANLGGWKTFRFQPTNLWESSIHITTFPARHRLLSGKCGESIFNKTLCWHIWGWLLVGLYTFRLPLGPLRCLPQCLHSMVLHINMTITWGIQDHFPNKIQQSQNFSYPPVVKHGKLENPPAIVTYSNRWCSQGTKPHLVHGCSS